MVQSQTTFKRKPEEVMNMRIFTLIRHYRQRRDQSKRAAQNSIKKAFARHDARLAKAA